MAINNNSDLAKAFRKLNVEEKEIHAGIVPKEKEPLKSSLTISIGKAQNSSFYLGRKKG